MKMAYINFTGGEINASLSSRYDLSKFKSSCRYLENFIPELHGPLRRRMGSYFLEDLGGFAILLPFEFSSDPAQNYVLVLQEEQVRIAQRNGFVRYAEKEEETEAAESGTPAKGGGTSEETDVPPRVVGDPVVLRVPYKAEELYDISYAQSGDVVYLAHHGHPLHKIMRYGHDDWRVEQVTYMPSIEPPTALKGGFSSSGSYSLGYKVAAVNAKGETSRAASITLTAKHPNDWVVGDYVNLSWTASEGAESYVVYRAEAGNYGIVGVSGTECRFRDDKYMADMKDTPSEPKNPFADGNNPGVVCFHQQRLILAAPALQPQTWYGSRTGSYEDFSKSRPIKDDDSLEFTLASGRIDMIQWAAAFGDLLVGTAGSEYKAIGADQGTITPTSLTMREQSYWGSIKLRPLIIGNSVLHVQRQGSRVRDLTYSLERDGYAGNDLSVMASHLFDRYLIKQWCYQQSPGSVIWCIRDDGMMLALVYLKEHDIWGWTRITTEGKYRSVISTAGNLEDELYSVVEREINGKTKWYLERFLPRWHSELPIDDAFFVDCGLSYHDPDFPLADVGGLDHLEGCEVSILADGSPVAPQVVHEGKIVLPYSANTIHVGLGYRSLMCPQTPEAESPDQGSSLGRVRGYGLCSLRLQESVGGKYGPQRETLYDLPFVPDTYGDPVNAFTGDIGFTPDTSFTQEGELWVAQELPLPFTVVALVTDVDIQG